MAIVLFVAGFDPVTTVIIPDKSEDPDVRVDVAFGVPAPVEVAIVGSPKPTYCFIVVVPVGPMLNRLTAVEDDTLNISDVEVVA